MWSRDEVSSSRPQQIAWELHSAHLIVGIYDRLAEYHNGSKPSSNTRIDDMGQPRNSTYLISKHHLSSQRVVLCSINISLETSAK